MKNSPEPIPPVTELRNDYYQRQFRDLGRRYQKFDWTSVEVILNLLGTHNVMFNRFAMRMRRYGLSPAAFNVLMILFRNEGQKLKQHDISRLLLVSRANVTGLLKTLVRKGWVRRECDCKDRRAQLVSITLKGKQVLKRYLPRHYSEIDRIFTGFGPGKKKQINSLMSQLRSRIF